MNPRRLVPIALLTAMLAACGDSKQTSDRARSAPAVPAPGERRSALELPAGVPLKATGAADPGAARVVRAWAGALRAGDIAAASALWAVPSKVQNGTPVLRLSSASAVRVFNEALPCGSVVTSTGGAPHDFTVVTVRLTRRRGADCASGVGAVARTAIRVQDAKITEWYRLPDDPDAPGLLPPPDEPVDSTTI